MSDESELIDGGELLSVDEARPVEGRARRVEDTRATLAFCLFGLLAFVMIALVLLLWFRRLDEQEFSEVAAIVISPLVGLVGAVTGYYYGKADR